MGQVFFSENKMKKNYLLNVTLLLTFLLVFTGCSQGAKPETAEPTQAPEVTEAADTQTLSYDGALAIKANGETFEVPFNDIYTMETVELTAETIDSKNQASTLEVKGVKLDTVLSTINLSQKDALVIRLTAGDGYAIDVPEEIVSAKDIVLAYEIDGSVLEPGKMPLRAVINGERAMYYVSNLIEVSLNSEATPEGTDKESEEEPVALNKKAYVIENMVDVIEAEDYNYKESVDKAIKVQDAVAMFAPQVEENASVVAADGFTKTETLEVLLEGYFKISGDNKPLFIAPDLPKGMQIKQIKVLDLGDVVFFSGEHIGVGLETKQARNKEGIGLTDVLTQLNMSAEKYTCTATDGYSVEIEAAAMENGILYVSEEGVYNLKFTEDYPKNYGIKNLASIEIVE